MSSLTIAPSAPRQSAAEPELATKNAARQDEFSRMVADASERKSKTAEPGALGAKGSAKERSAEASDEKSIEDKQGPRSGSGDRTGPELALGEDRVAGDRAGGGDGTTGKADEAKDVRRAGSVSGGNQETRFAEQASVVAAAEPEDGGQSNEAKDAASDNPEIEVAVAANTQAAAATVLAVAPFLNAKSAAHKQSGSTAPQRAPSDGNAAASVKSAQIDGTQQADAVRRDDIIQSAFGRSGEAATPAKSVTFAGDRGGGQAAVSAQAANAMPNNTLPPMPATDAAKASIPTITVDISRLPGREAEGLGATRELIASHVTRVAAMPNPGQPVPVLRLQLQPVHLGQINVTMRMADGAVSVQLTPDSETAARVLATDRDSIVAAVRALGGSLANASIEVGGDGQIRQGADDGGQQRNAGSDLREGAQGGSTGFGRSGNDAQGSRDDASRAVERDRETSSDGGRIII